MHNKAKKYALKQLSVQLKLIFGIDKTGNANEWNNETAEITRFSKDEALNKPLVSTFIAPSLRALV